MIGERVGEGLTAEIYAWDAGRVVKLFKRGFSLDDASGEAFKARLAANLGVSAPRVYEEVEIDGRFGFVMDEVSGGVLGDVHETSDVADAARRLAELHARLHTIEAPAELGSQRAKLEADIARANGLPEDLRVAALERLKQLPSGNTLCHGDFHAFNVMATGDDAVIVDWVDATGGNPLADVARTLIITENGHLHALNPSERDRIKRLIGGFNETYLARYLAITGVCREDVKAWLAPVAAARMSENVRVETGALLDLIRASR